LQHDWRLGGGRIRATTAEHRAKNPGGQQGRQHIPTARNTRARQRYGFDAVFVTDNARAVFDDAAIGQPDKFRMVRAFLRARALPLGIA